jgi:hypothetical protein
LDCGNRRRRVLWILTPEDLIFLARPHSTNRDDCKFLHHLEPSLKKTVKKTDREMSKSIAWTRGLVYPKALA